MFGSLQFPRVKMLLHALQGFVIFLGWALTIAVLTQDGPTDGRTAYYFALCWLTVPALIYLAAVPLWPRTQRFGNAYAFAVIDVLFGILWFASWVAVASYVAAGKVAGKDDDNDKDMKGKSGCGAFKFGTPAKCNISTGTVILGVIICLLFIVTSYMSIRNLSAYRRSGSMLYEGASDPSFAAHSKAAFSSNPAHDFDYEDDRDAEFRSGRRSTEGVSVIGGGPSSSLGYRRDQDDEYTLLHNEADDLGGMPHEPPAPPSMYDATRGNDNSNALNNTPLTNAGDANASYLHDYDTSYGGAYAAGSRSQASGSFHDQYTNR
ncbi:hypothetical protein I7I48_01011 [Histoplasma ohiense]|nr:hypothetical protein I7I48_01011 [Histoplasma ohiense (nom. inval.)]